MTAVVLPFWFDRPPLEALEIAAAAEDLAFPELWIGEMMTFDAFALAGAIARQTRNLTLWVGPLAIGVRDPAALALGIASVAVLGGRPAHLALGASTPTVVAQWHGRPWERTVAHMRETVAAVRPLLAGERSSFRGRHAASEGFRLAAGAQPTRLAVAAFGPRMIEAAATIADRVVLNLLTPAQVARVRTSLDEAAGAAGVPAPALVAWVPAALEPTEATRQQLARQLVAYLAPPGYGEMFTEAGFGDVVTMARGGAHPRDLMKAIPPALIEAVGAIGGEAEIRRRLRAYSAAGADVVGIVPASDKCRSLLEVARAG